MSTNSINQTKVCTRRNNCVNVNGPTLPLSEFNKAKNGKYGVRSICRECQNCDGAEYSSTNKERLRQKAKHYRLNNKEKTKKYRESIKHKATEYRIEYYKLNKEELKKYNSEYREHNKDKRNNREKIRRSTDPVYNLSCILRATTIKNIKRGSGKKAYSTEKLLGCTIEECRNHLESLFQEGMTWENHGTHGWHIDHIRPCASFDLTDPEQQKQCFNYNNLQPLWAIDNIRKSNKWDKNKGHQN